MKTNPFEKIGETFIYASNRAGQLAFMIKSTVIWFFKAPVEYGEIVKQSVRLGVNSVGVVMLTGLFTGMVLALQTGYTSISLFNEPLYIGTVVGFSIVKELGPVLTAMVVAGRAGAAVTAEIGTMKVTEQIDALYTLGTNPSRYLLIPRYFAFFITLPILTIIADFLGVLGGFAVAMIKLRIPSTVYWDNIFIYMDISNFMHGFLKTFFFAFIIATVSCYKGLKTEGGAEGVGKATTESVVGSMLLVLVFDYFISAFFIVIGLI